MIFYFQLLIFFSFVFSLNLNEWENISSTLSPNKIVKHNNNIIGATIGGLFVYDSINDEFNQYESSYSECLNISDLAIDLNSELWVLCENGIVFKDNSSMIINHLDIDKAHNLVISGSDIFMLYEKEDVSGIIQINYNNEELFFNDYYQGFTSVHASFMKLSIFNNVLYLLTDEGIYYGDLNSNLKFTSNWDMINDTEGVIDIFHFDEKMVFLSNDEIDFVDVNDILINQDNIQIVSTSSYDVGNYIDSYRLSNEIYILGEDKLISLNADSFETIHYQDNFDKAMCLFVDENKIYIGIQDQSFWVLDSEINKCAPNTLLSLDIEALEYNNEILYGVNRDGIFIYDQESISNLLSDKEDHPYFEDNSYLTSNNFYDCNNFKGTQLEYVPGTKISSSIVFHDEKLYVPNSGILPDLNSNKGGVVVIDTQDLIITSIIDTSYLDGLGGIYYDDVDDSYLTINQVIKDPYNRIWIVNPYAEHSNQILAYFNPLNDTWSYIEAPDDVSYLPQEIAFDQWGRIWVAFRNEAKIDGGLYSSGGIKLVTQNGNWINIEGLDQLPGDDGDVNVWSLDFGEFEGNDILWVLTSNGVQGYSLSGNRIDPIYPIDFFTNIPFSKGDKIKVDPQNNVWVITAHSGIRVIKNDISFWPSAEGLTTENSDILSNVVRDVTFDNENGLAFIATDKGVSILGIPFKDNKRNTNVGVSPNPFIVGNSNYITIEEIYSGSMIKVMTLEGRVVKKIQLPYNENRINWDGRGENGNFLDSGVYLLVVENSRYGNGVTKLAIIK